MRRKSTYVHRRLYACEVDYAINGVHGMYRFSLYAKSDIEARDKAREEATQSCNKISAIRVSPVT